MRGEGRQQNGLTWTGAAVEFDHYRVKKGTRDSTEVSGTSIFDPVLCELVYRWFCPAGGAVLDPFAGRQRARHCGLKARPPLHGD